MAQENNLKEKKKVFVSVCVFVCLFVFGVENRRVLDYYHFLFIDCHKTEHLHRTVPRKARL